MLDRRLIRDDPERVIRGIKSKNVDVDIDKIIALDRRLLGNMQESEKLKHERNVKSEEVARRKRAGEKADDLHGYLKELSQRIKDHEAADKEIEELIKELGKEER